MKISHRISSLKRRDIDRDVNQINNKDELIDFNNFVETTYSSSYSNNYQTFGSDDTNNHPIDSNSSWRIPAILGLVWTTVILLIVFIFIMKKTIFSGPDADQPPETNPENEWMIASFDNSDNDNIEVPLSTNISRETIDN